MMLCTIFYYSVVLHAVSLQKMNKHYTHYLLYDHSMINMSINYCMPWIKGNCEVVGNIICS